MLSYMLGANIHGNWSVYTGGMPRNIMSFTDMNGELCM